jgi:hypothetical protein
MAFRYKKNQRLVIQSQFRRMDARLQFIALSVMGFTDHVFGKDIVITEIYRTRQQQESYYPNQPYRPSVHQFGRGIDFGIRPYRPDDLDPWPYDAPTGCPALEASEVQTIDDWFSAVVSYDDERPDMDSLIHHNVGLGDHLHLQVSWRKSTRLRSECNQAQLIMRRLGVTL